jgi:hypothetical protein
MSARDAIAAAGLVVAGVLGVSAQAPTGLRAYREFLAKLDATSPACLEQATTALRAGFGSGEPDGEAAVRAFREYYLARVADWEKALWEPGARELTYGAWLPPEEHRLVEPLPIGRIRVNGSAAAQAARLANPTLAARLDDVRRWPFAVVQAEGDWYLQPDAEWLAAAANAVPGRLADFLAFVALESKEVVAEDAGLRVPWDGVRVRLARWETFALGNPGLPEVAKEVTPHVTGLYRVYLCQLLDNTPPYNRTTGVLDPSLQASYRRLVSENRDMKGHAFVEGLLAQLAVAKFRLTPTVERYLARRDSPAPCEVGRR